MYVDHLRVNCRLSSLLIRQWSGNTPSTGRKTVTAVTPFFNFGYVVNFNMVQHDIIHSHM